MLSVCVCYCLPYRATDARSCGSLLRTAQVVYIKSASPRLLASFPLKSHFFTTSSPHQQLRPALFSTLAMSDSSGSSTNSSSSSSGSDFNTCPLDTNSGGSPIVEIYSTDEVASCSGSSEIAYAYAIPVSFQNGLGRNVSEILQ